MADDLDEIDFYIFQQDDDSLKDETVVDDVELNKCNNDNETLEIFLSDVDWDENIIDSSILSDKNCLAVIPVSLGLEEKQEGKNTDEPVVGKKPILMCPTCRKKYVREYALKNHIEKCGKEGQKASSVKKSTKNVSVLQITETDVVQKSKSIVTDLLTEYADDPMNNIKLKDTTTLGNSIRDISLNLLASKDTPVFENSAINHCKALFGFASSVALHKEAALEKFWKQVNNFGREMSSRLLWIGFDGIDINSEAFSSLFFTMSTGISGKIIALENQKRLKKSKPEQNLKISENEQNVIFYVGGFIISHLRKRYFDLSKSTKLSTREAAGVALRFLNTVKVKGAEEFSTNSFLDFVKQWTEILNRGGLTTVDNITFILFRRIEMVVRKILNVSFLRRYKSEDLRDIIMKLIYDDSLVQKGWEEMSKTMRNESLKNILFRQILTKWVDLRLKSFVETYVQVLKRTNARQKKKDKQEDSDSSKKTDPKKVVASQKAEPSMRKLLP